MFSQVVELSFVIVIVHVNVFIAVLYIVRRPLSEEFFHCAYSSVDDIGTEFFGGLACDERYIQCQTAENIQDSLSL